VKKVSKMPPMPEQPEEKPQRREKSSSRGKVPGKSREKKKKVSFLLELGENLSASGTLGLPDDEHPTVLETI